MSQTKGNRESNQTNFPTLPPIARESEAEVNDPLTAPTGQPPTVAPAGGKRACEARYRRQTQGGPEKHLCTKFALRLSPAIDIDD